MFAGSNAAKAEWSRFPADLRRDGGANLRVCEGGHGRGSLFPPVIYRDAGNFSVEMQMRAALQRRASKRWRL